MLISHSTITTPLYPYPVERYVIRVHFVSSSQLNIPLISSASTISENDFNSVTRKNAFKRINVTVLPTGELEIVYLSDKIISNRNLLLSLQYYSKSLSTQRGMSAYICPGRRLLAS